MKLLSNIKNEVGMVQWPVSAQQVDNILDYYFLSGINKEIRRLSLPALEPLPKRLQMSHTNESHESKVGILNLVLILYYS